ncbi:DMT family transporter [Oceanospirillum sediminis]|uniref:DMT family transporter n=1 Tax=Oceanospirillum sediminis TaxID=2760088 RepID=A0A839ITE8_9GAMM|nr:DMT family transporter [Oceanospirillum sediminis]MBB1488733.1 DMT family transporter [Oceanospirillum sediminis]
MKNYLLLVLWAWLMASSFMISGKVVPYANPLVTTELRFLLAAMIFLPFLLLDGKKGSLTGLLRKEIIGPYLIISGTLVTFFIGMFWALQTTTALNTSVIYTLVPLIGVIVSWFWLKQTTSLIRLSGFILGSIGAIIVLFSSRWQQASGWEFQSGDLIFLGASFFLATHIVSVQKWGGRTEPLQGAFLIVVLGSVVLLPLSLLFGDLPEVQWDQPAFWSALIYLAIFTTAMTFLLQQTLVSRVGAGFILAFSYTIPVWVATFTPVLKFTESLLSERFWQQIYRIWQDWAEVLSDYIFYGHLSGYTLVGFWAGTVLILFALILISGLGERWLEGVRNGEPASSLHSSSGQAQIVKSA